MQFLHKINTDHTIPSLLFIHFYNYYTWINENVIIHLIITSQKIEAAKALWCSGNFLLNIPTLLFLDETTDKSDSCINPSSPVEQSLQSFIATNLSNNTRRISSKNPSLTRRRSSVRSTNQDLSDKAERGAIVQSLEGINI